MACSSSGLGYRAFNSDDKGSNPLRATDGATSRRKQLVVVNREGRRETVL